MPSRQAPVSLWGAVAFLVVTAAAVPLSVAIAVQGRGFSSAGPDVVGQLALIGPVTLCIAAALAQLARHRDRPLVAVWVSAAGLTWMLAEWDNPEAGWAWIFSLGLAGFAAAPAVVLHLALTDARGRLPGPAHRMLVAAGYTVTVGVQGVLSAVGFLPSAQGCVSCPPNLWHAITVDGWAPLVDALGVRAGLIWSVLAMATLLVTALRASAARRRARSWRWLPAGAFLAVTAPSYTRSLDRGFLGADVVDRRLWLLQSAALGAVAVGVLAELRRERHAQRELAGIVVDLSAPSSPARSLRDALAVRLDDPDLVLAFPVDAGLLLDESASPVEPPGPDATRLVTELRHGSETLATLVHRRDAVDTPDAVDDLVAAIHLALEHERLRVKALAQVMELRASASRLVVAGDDERRRLERDLHDGAQQRLVGLALGLRLLAVRSGDSAALRGATTELQAAIDELRALARGLSPLVLSRAGLATAVRALAESRDLRLVEAPDRRFSAVVESTAYLAVDRASVGSPAEVAVRVEHEQLTVTVRVRGPDPDLGDLPARATTLGGEVLIRSLRAGCEIWLGLPVLPGDGDVSRAEPEHARSHPTGSSSIATKRASRM